MTYTIKVAETEAERRAAFHVRWRVFAEELGETRYADNERQLWTDEHDEPGRSTILIARDESTVFATVRITYRKYGPFINDDGYAWSKLALFWAVEEVELHDTTCLWDRGVVLSSHRGQQVMFNLSKAVEEYAHNNKMHYIVGAVDQKNTITQKLLHKCGHDLYATQVFDDSNFGLWTKKL